MDVWSPVQPGPGQWECYLVRYMWVLWDHGSSSFSTSSHPQLSQTVSTILLGRGENCNVIHMDEFFLRKDIFSATLRFLWEHLRIPLECRGTISAWRRAYEQALTPFQIEQTLLVYFYTISEKTLFAN